MCAGTVVEPAVAVSAASVSVTSRSRSVAFSDNFAFSALTSTLPRIGIVLRRSTTRWTWPSDFRSCARSTVTFIALLARSPRKPKSGKAGRRNARHGTEDPGKPDHPADMTKAARVAQGGSESHPFQGIGAPVPHDSHDLPPKRKPPPQAWPGRRENGGSLGFYS